MFKKFSVALLVTMFVVVAPAFGDNAATTTTPAPVAPVAAPAVVDPAKTTATTTPAPAVVDPAATTATTTPAPVATTATPAVVNPVTTSEPKKDAKACTTNCTSSCTSNIQTSNDAKEAKPSIITRAWNGTKGAVNTVGTKTKEAGKATWDFTSAKAEVVGGLIKAHPVYSGLLGAIATFTLLYNYNDDFKHMVRGFVGCSDDQECASFCSKRKI